MQQLSNISDSELLEIVTEFRNGILEGRKSVFMCCAVSWPLQSYLSWSCGLETKLIHGEVGDMEHVWLEMEDGRIIDPTADQFFELWGCNKMPPVYIGPIIELYGNIQDDI